jgi:hypothetical protein
MTVLDDRYLAEVAAVSPRPAGTGYRSDVHRRTARPRPSRPVVAPLHYRCNGVRVSQAPHGSRPVSTSASIALAGLAALITLWLGLLANFSGDRTSTPAQIPDRLAVVQVNAGETLYQLADRVAPQTPAAEVVQRIRDLNKLDSASVDAGQTLIAPIG